MATSFVNVGSIANDGTGDPVRTAFITVNQNFDLINSALFSGTAPSIVSATDLTAGRVISNTYIQATSYVSAANVIAGAITSNGNLYITQDGAYIVGNVTIIGNLSVSGTQAATAGAQATNAAQTTLHYSETPLTVNDGKDIGTQWQYFDTSDKKSFFGWQNSTGSLVYLDDITEVSNVIIDGSPGNVQFGSLLLSNTTTSSNSTTGALVVDGGVGVGGNINVLSNLYVGNTANVANLTVRGYVAGSLNFTGLDTIYINGSPVATAASSFNGGSVAFDATFTSTSPSTSASTGAFVVTGGVGVGANLNVGGNVGVTGNVILNNGATVRGNVQGNVLTAAQPFVTSLGTLTSLTMGGTLNSNDISPNSNLLYNLGTATNDRWNKLWVFDIDMSGSMTAGGQINGAGGTQSGNIALNTATAAALTTTTAVGELFNTGATTIRIGGDGVTQFRNNTQATSTTTGAVQVTGGMSIDTGNLYVGGSSGNAIVARDTVWITEVSGNAMVVNGPAWCIGNIQSTSTTTGEIVTRGGIAISQGNLYIGGSGGNAAVVTGNIWISGNLLPGGANVSRNLGSTTQWWNTFYGISSQAQYADLAENYQADAEYEVGTVVIFGGKKEITVTKQFADHRVAGVVSGAPAYLMNAMDKGTAVALRGRVPVKVVGPVDKGDLLVTSDLPGYAVSVGGDTSHGVKIFAKSLDADGDLGEKIIEAVIL